MTTIKTANKNVASIDKDILAVAKAMAGLRDEIKAVASTVPRNSAACMKRPGLTEPHSLVVKNGSLWISLTKTTLGPGTGDWQLPVTKSGDIK